jgi:outer membrane receptor protein involved in Fe transport
MRVFAASVLDRPTHAVALALTSLLSIPVWAGGEQILEKVVVSGATSALGVADAASVGTVTQKQLEARTVYRPGELLESVPGLIVSQHSGEGKANQFYLRGFNLDHGTDLRTTIDGMPVNQRSHAHGQGWTDVNFLIPELARQLEYRKGPYFASEGDFASAGSVNIKYVDRLGSGIASVGVGQNGYRHALLANSPQFVDGTLLYAVEGLGNDGPFVNPDRFRKFNGVLRFSKGDESNGFNVTAMGYIAKWNATDQITQRAIDAGFLRNRFDAIDATDGGAAHRYSLSGAWQKSDGSSSTQGNAYLIDNKLTLFSNFTYFLDNPVDGDQFAQPDRRRTSGFNLSHARKYNNFGLESENTFGAQFQTDNIFNSLLNTKARQTIGATRRDHITETSLGLYAENATKWSSWLRTVVGVRADAYRFNVNGDNQLNAGSANDSIVNPKLSLIFGPWSKTEFYVNTGGGFHSNDARGTAISVDPKTGDPVDRATPLVRSKGAELGVRGNWLPGLQTSLSFYQLDLASELLLVGDAGTTEASRPSRRLGFEIANYYKLSNWLTVDADVAFARARFLDNALGANRIPGAVEGVASFAVAVDNLGPWFGAAQIRCFGPRPLVEDNSVRSKSTANLNARIGYRLTPKMRMELEVFNLTNRMASAIDYFYTSRLPGESAAGTDAIHFHPIESRSFRLSLALNF